LPQVVKKGASCTDTPHTQGAHLAADGWPAPTVVACRMTDDEPCPYGASLSVAMTS
jgi:hypothetical protein